MLGDPFAKLEDPLLVAGRAKISAFTGKREKKLTLALPTLDPGEALTEIAAVQALLHDSTDDGAIEPIPLLIGRFIAGFKFVNVLGEALIEAGRFGIARLIDPFEHDLLVRSRACSRDIPAFPPCTILSLLFTTCRADSRLRGTGLKEPRQQTGPTLPMGTGRIQLLITKDTTRRELSS